MSPSTFQKSSTRSRSIFFLGLSTFFLVTIVSFGLLSPFEQNAAKAQQAVLFRDDFNGSVLSSDWRVADWTFPNNRAYFGLTPRIANGFARLQLNTYNPEHRKFFKGTEIYTNRSFERGTSGIQLTARVRLNMREPGAIASFFTYTQIPPNGYADEIDFEFLTKQISGTSANHRVLTTSWHNWGEPGSTYDNGTNHRASNPRVSGLNLRQFNTFTIRWLPTRTEWWVNGKQISTWSNVLPAAPMSIRFNFWPPDFDWPEAYSEQLRPASSAASNRTFTYDVDYVEVRAI